MTELLNDNLNRNKMYIMICQLGNILVEEKMIKTSIRNGVVHWTGDNCFNMNINPQIRKSSMASITGYDEGFLTMEFADRSWVTITYPVNLVDLAKEIETGLLEYKGWKREKLTTQRIKRIMDCLMDYLEEIKRAIKIQDKNANTTKHVLKPSIRSIIPLMPEKI